MNQTPYTPPEYRINGFNCPFCNAYALQNWGYASIFNGSRYLDKTAFAVCSRCNEYSIWHNESMIYPDSSQAPLPNSDLPDDIKNDYEEARSIINRSPRGAAALLRLCIQKLCKSLGESGKNINNDIASLVKKGLNPQIQKSLDIIRVIGNEAVHPGTIDLEDNSAIAITLCELINFIADAMITQPKKINGMFENLPEDKKKQIAERDKQN